ncbi:MAG: PqqD family protein [Candidatus Lindowbacteria bacterium]|nr:PqqD family protein [Candidatus Lindowbacteria bacterium]
MAQKYGIEPELSWRVIDDEAVILRMSETTYYSLNPVGTMIWNEMEKHPCSRDELIEKVFSGCEGTDLKTVTTDVDELLKDFVQQNLVVEINA